MKRTGFLLALLMFAAMSAMAEDMEVWLKHSSGLIVGCSSENRDAIVTLPSSHHVSEECRSLSGIRLNAPMRGINIIRSADGKTRKVFVR